jgi:hypothetical protein
VSHTARLIHRHRVEEIDVLEVPVAERSPLLASYRDRFGKMHAVGPVLRALADPPDHPMFRITTTGDPKTLADGILMTSCQSRVVINDARVSVAAVLPNIDVSTLLICGQGRSGSHRLVRHGMRRVRAPSSC